MLPGGNLDPREVRAHGERGLAEVERASPGLGPDVEPGLAARRLGAGAIDRV